MKRVLAIVLAWPSIASAGEADVLGPYEIEVDGYDFGDTAFQPVGLSGPVEMRARVYNPTALDEGPFPIVLVMHGRHGTCYDPENPLGTPGDGSFSGAFIEWPCSPGREEIPSFEGYDYLGQMLASHGMIIVSVSANGINGLDNESADFGMAARADLFNEHLLQWSAWNESGAEPFGDRFVGAVDFEHIGLVGHSRGGEGAASSAYFDQQDGAPNFIDAALLVAPTDVARFAIGNVALASVLPYCDGDVFDLAGVHYFDDARHAVPGDVAPKYAFSFDGSNHNFYNTVWTPGGFASGTSDDFAYMEEAFGPDAHCGIGQDTRLSPAQQQESLAAYAGAFFRVHLRGETDLDPVLRGDEIPAAAEVARPGVSYIGPDAAEARLDVNRLDAEASLTVNELGEAVEIEGAADYSLCGLADDFLNTDTYAHCVADPEIFMGFLSDGRQPHTPGLGQLRIAFEDGGAWTNHLPAGTDVSAFAFVQLRIAVDYESPLAMGGEVRLELTDAEGSSASVALTDALPFPPGNLRPVTPRKLLRGVRVPLAELGGIDLTDVASVSLRVEGAAALMVSELAFSDAVPDEGGSSSSGGESESSGEPASTSSTASTGEAGSTSEADSSGTSTTAPAGGGDDGCGCRSTPRSAAWWLLVVPALRRRRAS
jgi:hypothetical protein